MNNLVTRKQAEILRNLGFKDVVSSFMSRLSKEDEFAFLTKNVKCANFNSEWYTLSIPTVDEAIDYLRRKHKILIQPDISLFSEYTIINVWQGYSVYKLNGKTVYSAKRKGISYALKLLKK